MWWHGLAHLARPRQRHRQAPGQGGGQSANTQRGRTRAMVELRFMIASIWPAGDAGADAGSLHYAGTSSPAGDGAKSGMTVDPIARERAPTGETRW